MNWYQMVLIVHVALGTIALIAFWVTAMLRKGTSTHRRVGSSYLTAMLGVMVTAAPLAGSAFTTGHTLNGVFLTYLIVITGTPLWAARRAIRYRHSAVEFASRTYRFIGALNLMFAVAVLGLGIGTGTVLLTALSVVGFFVGIRIVRFDVAQTSRRWWLKQHYLNMVGSGIASHVAFLNVGLPRFIPLRFQSVALYAAWFAPIVGASLAAWWLNRRYGRGADGVRLASSTPSVS